MAAVHKSPYTRVHIIFDFDKYAIMPGAGIRGRRPLCIKCRNRGNGMTHRSPLAPRHRRPDQSHYHTTLGINASAH